MSRKREWWKLALAAAVFAVCCYLPVWAWGGGRVGGAIGEALALVRWYARRHVLLSRRLDLLLVQGVQDLFRVRWRVGHVLGLFRRRHCRTSAGGRW